MRIKNNTSAFSLIEILIGILITSMLMIAGFQALSAVGVGKIKIIEKTRIEKQAYFASERFFEMIKKGGQIDYEEYWNRYSYDTLYSSGHFDKPSGFGNFGKDGNIETTSNYGRRQYHCISGKNPGISMGTGGCLQDNNVSLDLGILDNDYSGLYQRYTQYERQFIDRNSDKDTDAPSIRGDENQDGSVLDDADDSYLGIGPEAFPVGIDMKELYLINSRKGERIFFRWNVKLDPNAPIGASCSGNKNMTGSGCLGIIEFLKLNGKDYGYDHDNTGVDPDGSQGDGIIDTWLIHPDFLTGAIDVVAGSNSASYWQTLFPNSIHVSELEFYIYPHKDIEYSWKDIDPSLQIAPYIQLKMTLQPSWKEKRKIKGEIPKVTISTTIQLSDLNFR